MMIGIFYFSSKNDEESTEDSEKIGFFIAKYFVRDFEEKSVEKQHEIVEGIDYPIRKTAHFIEYAILGILLFMSMYDAEKNTFIRNNDDKKTENRYTENEKDICVLKS